MLAAQNGHADIIKVLLKAGASIEAKNKVSKRTSICTCVCVCVCVCVVFLHYSVVFSSSILLLWCVGYDDFISMNNVFVFVLIIIILLLVLLLANMKMNILEKSPFSISHKFVYFSVFFHFIFLHYFSSIYIFLINCCFIFFSLLVSSFCL